MSPLSPEQAQQLVASMSRAREIQATEDAPSLGLQARVIAAATEAGVTVGFERTMLLDRMAWNATVTTSRGKATRVVPLDTLKGDLAWEEAFRGLGVID